MTYTVAVRLAGVLSVGLGWGIWREVRRSQLRQHAIHIAAGKLPRSEQVDWFNRIGRYQISGTVPRTLEPEQMNADEYHRYANRLSLELAERHFDWI